MNEAVLNASLAAFAAKLDGYESILATAQGGEGKYLAGQNLTLVDLFHLPLGQKLVSNGLGHDLTDEKKRPHVAK